jgi:CRP/FNR family transcriptional regulator, cyclic AMP receptor protein
LEAELRRIELFADLPAETLRDIAADLTPLHVLPGQAVIDHLARSDSVFFVLSGQFRVQIFAANGRQVALRMLGPGAVFGELAVLSGAPRSASVLADSAGLICEMRGAVFVDLLGSTPGLAMKLIVALARNVTVLNDRVFELSAMETRFRLYTELLRLAKGQRVTPLGTIITPAPTHEQIAQSVGTQREAVTRELRQLAKEGRITHRRGEIVIKDIDGLRAMVQQRSGLAASYLVDWSV